MNPQLKKRLEGLGLAEPKAEALARICGQLVEKAAGGVTGLVLYGSLARKQYVAGESDINLAIILSDTTPATLQSLSGPLREGFRTLRLEPFLVTVEDVLEGADVFPTKFRDIATYHVVLDGTSPFGDLAISRAHLRLRVEQELRNLTLRLRRRYVALVDDPERLAHEVAEVVPGFTVELTALLGLLSKPPAVGNAPKDILAAAAKAFGWSANLGRLATHSAGPHAAEQVRADAEALMAVVASAAKLANDAPEAT